mgnify:CR=1 FL=1
MKELKNHILISLSDSKKFSKLSADYNPMHIDENYARRLQFGGTVLHGVHTCLRLIEDVLSSGLVDSAINFKTLSVTFQSPVKTGNKIDYIATFDSSSKLLKIVAYTNTRRALSLKISFQDIKGQSDNCLNSFQQSVVELKPENMLFPPEVNQSIKVPLAFDQALAMELFPVLVKECLSLQLAQLLATTYVVGMKCPGLNSIFSGLKLDYMAESPGFNADSIVYEVDKVDDRFNQVKISVFGEKFSGTIEAFFRPEPIVQSDFSVIQKMVSSNEFKNQKVLVIGGTRGLGEVTAKILAAAGADVAITYFRGDDDAKRVCKDIQRGGGICRYSQFDVTQSSSLEQIVLNEWQPDYIYYFATPLIEMNNSNKWDGTLFRRFCDYYVDGLAHALEAFGFNDKGSTINKYVFYPSTIYVSESTKGFLEYATAKAAGEAFCELSHQNQQNLLFFCPRLQRLKTDQTNAITIVDADDPVKVMYHYISEFQQQVNDLRNI